MTFGERLVELRKENGFNTRNEFAEKLGIPGTTLRNYETNAREPGHTFLKQISELFNVSVDYLLCLTDDKEVLNSFRLRSSEQDLIEKYRSLDPRGQETVIYILDREIAQKRMIERLLAYRDRFSELHQKSVKPMSMVAKEPSQYMPDAAHERTDIEVTEEMRRRDDDIMNGDNF